MNRTVLALWLVLAALAALPAPAAASVLDMTDAGVTMVVPDGWTTQRDGAKFVLFPDDQSMAMVVAVVDETAVDGFVRDIRRNQDAALSGVKSTGKSDVQVNGLAVTRETGTGDAPDGAAIWSLSVVHARRPVIVYTLTSRESLRKHETEYNAMLGSLRKVEPKGSGQ